MQIVGGRAVNAIKVDDPAQFPSLTLVQSDAADIGDLWDGTAFSKDGARAAAQAEAARLSEIDSALKADATIATVAAKSNADYESWWTARTAADKDKMLKFLVRAEARRA